MNPGGRTGLTGRWGPNHAADSIVTCWKISENEYMFHKKSNKPIIQFVAIQRKDSGEWALPGGMIEHDEVVSSTLKREFMEEAMNLLEQFEDEAVEMEKGIKQLFNNGVEVFRGYVDDLRNTDNAWMETTVNLFHDYKGIHMGMLKLHAGDDAIGVKWVDLDENLKQSFLKGIVIKLKCH